MMFDDLKAVLVSARVTGKRITVVATTRPVHGTVREVTDELVTLENEWGVVSVPLDGIACVEQSHTEEKGNQNG